MVTRGKSLFAFDFEKYHVLYMPDPKNPDCLRFALPCIYEVDDDNRQAVFGVVNRINALINYVKLFEVNDQIWVLYEHCLVGMDDEDKLDGLTQTQQQDMVDLQSIVNRRDVAHSTASNVVRALVNSASAQQ